MISLVDFLSGNRYNSWVSHGQYYIYVRSGSHFIVNQPYYTFDVANILCPDVTARGQGEFWKFLDSLPELIRQHRPKEYSYLFIESVVNAKLALSLKNRGWSMTGDDLLLSPSFWKALV